MTGGCREQCGKKTASSKPQTASTLQPEVQLALTYLSSKQHQWPQHTHPAAQADWHSFQPWHQPATVTPLHHHFPVLGSPLTPALLRAKWSIPDTLSPPVEMKIWFGSSPNSLETQPLPSGSVQAEVQSQNIRRAYFVQLPWGRILELFLNRCIVLWGSAKGWTAPPVLVKPHLLIISHTPHGGLERLMISDKMQMIQQCNVQVSFMLASPAAFFVSMGHCASVCLWYAEIPWQSRQQHFSFWAREGKEKRVTSPRLSHRASGLLQRRCQMTPACPCWSTSFKLMNTQHFSERDAPLHLDTHLKVYDSSHGCCLPTHLPFNPHQNHCCEICWDIPDMKSILQTHFLCWFKCNCIEMLLEVCLLLPTSSLLF